MTISPLDILPVAIDRAAVLASDHGLNRGVKVWQAANDLWSDEYHAWRALASVGLKSAADCAWARRTAACDLSIILLRTM